MSRSRRRNLILKDSGVGKDLYWRIVRSAMKQDLREEKDPRNAKEIVNDRDYTDWIYNCMSKKECRCMKLFGRKKCYSK